MGIQGGQAVPVVNDQIPTIAVIQVLNQNHRATGGCIHIGAGGYREVNTPVVTTAGVVGIPGRNGAAVRRIAQPTVAGAVRTADAAGAVRTGGGNGGADIVLHLLQLLLIRLNGFLILGALLGELAHLGIALCGLAVQIRLGGRNIVNILLEGSFVRLQALFVRVQLVAFFLQLLLLRLDLLHLLHQAVQGGAVLLRDGLDHLRPGQKTGQVRAGEQHVQSGGTAADIHSPQPLTILGVCSVKFLLLLVNLTLGLLNIRSGFFNLRLGGVNLRLQGGLVALQIGDLVLQQAYFFLQGVDIFLRIFLLLGQAVQLALGAVDSGLNFAFFALQLRAGLSLCHKGGAYPGGQHQHKTAKQAKQPPQPNFGFRLH